MRSVFQKISLAVSVLAIGLGAMAVEKAYALPWSLDLYDQITIKPQEAIRDKPQKTVSPSDPPGIYMDQKSYLKLTNPHQPTEKSIGEGKKLYEIVCIACHGADGMGETPVSDKFQFPPGLPLIVPERTDGELFSQIYFGGDPMPAYGANLYPDEVWHLINYLRSLKEPGQ